MELQPHQKRVIDEREELGSRLEKLENFIGGIKFTELDPAEQSRLDRQFLVMQLYAQVLSERISAFGG